MEDAKRDISVSRSQFPDRGEQMFWSVQGADQEPPGEDGLPLSEQRLRSHRLTSKSSPQSFPVQEYEFAANFASRPDSVGPGPTGLPFIGSMNPTLFRSSETLTKIQYFQDWIWRTLGICGSWGYSDMWISEQLKIICASPETSPWQRTDFSD